jgi:hypothetical protein
MKFKVHIIFSLLLTLGSVNALAQIGIGTKTPAPSAALEVSSLANNKGILIPRLTATQKDAIVSPAEGLLVYQTTTPIGFYYYSNTVWKLIIDQTDLDNKLASAKTYVDDKIAATTIADADASTKGKIQLAGDLGGTAAAPTVPGLALEANTTDVTTVLALKATKSDVTAGLASKANTSDLATVATSGSYNDLVNKPNIPSAYVIPKASASVLGGVKVGTGLSIDGNGILSAAVSGTTTVSSVTGVLPIANGGTGQTTVPGILSTLGFASNNVAIGNVAGTPNQGVNAGTIAIGGGAGRGNQGAASVAIGYVSGDQNQGNASVAIGPNAAQSGQGTQAVAIGYAAGQNGQGAYSVAIGTFAGNVQAANSIALNATGASLNPTTTGFFVDPIINRTATSTALYYNTTTKEITSGTAASSGVPYTGATGAVNLGNYDLTVNGITAGMGSGNLGFNTVFGRGALSSTALTNGGNYNLATGYVALQSNTTGSFNTATGTYSLLKNTTGNNNTGYGVSSLFNNTSGNNNTAIGYGADVVSNNLSNATAIGYDAKVAADNTIQLGNTAVANVKTSGTLTAGTVTYPNAHNSTAGQLLSINASGTATWATPASSGGTHAVGEAYGGGIVFYTWDGGAHGLIGANTELNNGQAMSWGGGSGTYVGTTSFYGVLGGKLNTQRILNVIPVPTYGNGDPQTGQRSAAFYAATYLSTAVVVNGVTTTPQFSDWYLPNAYELTLFAAQSSYFPNCNFATHDHWSSSERSDYAYLAYALGANSSTYTYQDSKSSTKFVVAIRSF